MVRFLFAVVLVQLGCGGREALSEPESPAAEPAAAQAEAPAEETVPEPSDAPPRPEEGPQVAASFPAAGSALSLLMLEAEELSPEGERDVTAEAIGSTVAITGTIGGCGTPPQLVARLEEASDGPKVIRLHALPSEATARCLGRYRVSIRVGTLPSGSYAVAVGTGEPGAAVTISEAASEAELDGVRLAASTRVMDGRDSAAMELVDNREAKLTTIRARLPRMCRSDFPYLVHQDGEKLIVQAQHHGPIARCPSVPTDVEISVGPTDVAPTSVEFRDYQGNPINVAE